jgi:hypothetical protein
MMGELPYAETGAAGRDGAPQGAGARWRCKGCKVWAPSAASRPFHRFRIRRCCAGSGNPDARRAAHGAGAPWHRDCVRFVGQAVPVWKQRQQTGPQEPGTGKLANDHNKTGQQPPSQTNQGRRTPASRNDRQTMGAGPQNQVSARKGGGGAGRTPRGSG